MEFESNAVAFKIITTEMPSPGQFLDDLVQSELNFYDTAKNHDKGESAHLVFEGGSKIYIERSEDEEGELSDQIEISYLPGSEEKNYQQSTEVIQSLESALSGHDYEVKYITVGGLLEETIDELLEKHISVESSFDVDGIELTKEKYRYGISSKSEDDDTIRVTAVLQESKENLPKLKKELKGKLEQFVNEGE